LGLISLAYKAFLKPFLFLFNLAIAAIRIFYSATHLPKDLLLKIVGNKSGLRLFINLLFAFNISLY